MYSRWCVTPYLEAYGKGLACAELGLSRTLRHRALVHRRDRGECSDNDNLRHATSEDLFKEKWEGGTRKRKLDCLRTWSEERNTVENNCTSLRRRSCWALDPVYPSTRSTILHVLSSVVVG